MQGITQSELAEIYGVSPRTVIRWKKAKIDVFNPSEVYLYVVSLSREPASMRPKAEAVQLFEDLTNQKIADSDDDDANVDGAPISLRIAKQKLRKLTAEANRIEFLLAQAKNEYVSLADDVAPGVTQAIVEFCEEIEASYAELGELCDRMTGNEIMSKGLDLFYALRERFHARMVKVIEELEAA